MNQSADSVEQFSTRPGAKRRRAILLGCGGMSRAWLAALRDHHASRVEIAGLVDLRPEAARDRAAEFGLGEAWTGASLDEALRATAADTLFNCTVPEAHAATCEAALRAGCDVLVEKPLAPTVAEGLRLRRAAAETGRLLAVIQNRRYAPGAVTVRQALAGGAIGRVTSLHADFFLAPRFGGFREEMRHVLLLDMAIHAFDQCRQLTGLDARSVACHEFNPPGSWYAHGASASALFGMEGGVPFSYRGSWCARGFPTSWNAAWRVQGERGSLLWDGEEKVEIERIDGSWDGKEFFEPVEKLVLPLAALEAGATGHAGNIGEFLDALERGIEPQTSAADNLKSLAMVEAAIESARLGRSVAVAGEAV